MCFQWGFPVGVAIKPLLSRHFIWLQSGCSWCYCCCLISLKVHRLFHWSKTMWSGRSASVGKCFQHAFNQSSGIDVALQPYHNPTTTRTQPNHHHHHHHHNRHRHHHLLVRRLLTLIKTTHSAGLTNGKLWRRQVQRKRTRKRQRQLLSNGLNLVARCMQIKRCCSQNQIWICYLLGELPKSQQVHALWHQSSAKLLNQPAVGHKQVNTPTAESTRLRDTLRGMLQQKIPSQHRARALIHLT